MKTSLRKKAFNQQGVALVLVLAAVVLTCILVLAFFTQAELSKKISFSSAGQIRAENMARLGMSTIIDDLRSEIVAGSSSSTSNGTTIYSPTNNFTAVPSVIGADGFANVVKRSTGGSNAWIVGSDYSPSTPNPIRAIAGNSSTNVSVGGRFISATRWNAPYLLGTNVPATFKAPDWILVNRQGAVANGGVQPPIAQLSNNDVGNSNYVVGRFAYMIYDEGGTLDVNVAGFPSAVGADFTSRRGAMPQVDLGKIPGVLNANALVQWRNQATAASVGVYTNQVLTSTNGFATVAPGDQTFISRQDLIKYVKAHPAQITLEALANLGTFSRELAAPSYFPPKLNSTKRPRVQAGFPAAGMDDQLNPSLIDTRVSLEFVRTTSDGTTAKVGQPLLKYRFPLSRIAAVDRSATSSTLDNPYKNFGLTRSSANAPWVYNHGSGSKILNLAEVAARKREPDFFELLQASVGVGSLGQSGNDAYANVSTEDQKFSNQIVQLGANIIDQYDSDSFPTRISFNGSVISGVESLPYLNRVFLVALRPPISNSPAPGVSYPDMGFWYQPEIWNPHSSTGASSAAPTKFRYRVSGDFTGQLIDQGGVYSYPSDTLNHDPNKAIEFTAAPGTFTTPAILTPALVDMTSIDAGDIMTDSNTSPYKFIGRYMGKIANKNDINFDPPASIAYASAVIRPTGPINHILEYYDGSQWIKYSEMRNVVRDQQLSAYPPATKNYTPQLYLSHPDPRTDRFGIFEGATKFGAPDGLVTPYSNNPTIRPDEGTGWAQIISSPPPAWTYGANNFGLLSENKSTSTTRYTDPDGVTRRADGAYSDGNLNHGGYPLAIDSFSAQNNRPIILNRPLRSVGELGYAFRDMPWKNVDFFTTESGDAALLDVFCLNESPHPPIEAGRINPNTRNEAVLGAVLSGIIKADDQNTTISDTEAGILAANLVDFTTGLVGDEGPLANRADLVTRWVANLPSASADHIIKRRREASIRALADISNTRTWNLLIDVIAQSGRYTKTATGLDNFVVEGERRFWLHVAIDRYTNEIVSQQLEPVYE